MMTFFLNLMLLFFVILTAVAITKESWPRVVVAFLGMFTGIFMIPTAVQISMLLNG